MSPVDVVKRIIRRLVRFVYAKTLDRSLECDLASLDETREIQRLDGSTRILEQKMRCATVQMDLGCNQSLKLAVTPISQTSWQHEELFVLGSGQSLLELSSAEKEVIRSGATLAMNKYLLYWELIGIWPDYSFLADAHHPSTEVLTRKIEKVRIEKSRMTPRFLLSKDYEDWPLSSLAPVFFKRRIDNTDSFYWAETINDFMYFHRGSLTCLLNLITVLKLSKRVTLLGIDLNNGEAFYQEEYDKDLSLHDVWESFRKAGKPHPTAVEILNTAPIQARLPDVFQEMKESGIEVTCYNPSSLLVKEGLCHMRERLA